MSVALPFARMSVCLQAVSPRSSKRTASKRAPLGSQVFSSNNYLAEASSLAVPVAHCITEPVLGSRVAKEAARGPRQARALVRLHPPMGLKPQGDQRLAWAAAAAPGNAQPAACRRPIFSPNNYLAEGEGLVNATAPTTSCTAPPLPPPPAAITIILRAASRLAGGRCEGGGQLETPVLLAKGRAIP